MNRLVAKMHSYRDMEEAKALEGKPKNSWVAHVCQGEEVSCVHTSFPHGLISLGWNGPHKLIILDCDATDGYKKKDKKKIIETMFRIAETLAATLNKEYPKGISRSY